jgi:hypothetical protein
MTQISNCIGALEIAMSRVSLALWLLLASVTPGAAGGSFDAEADLVPLLARAPALRDFIDRHLDLDKSGVATRIGREVSDRLGGRRIGPYVIGAKPKGHRGDYIFDLVVHTETVFVDRDGRPSDPPGAYDVHETVRSFELRMAE